jgi:hypothetical protein
LDAGAPMHAVFSQRPLYVGETFREVQESFSGKPVFAPFRFDIFFSCFVFVIR